MTLPSSPLSCWASDVVKFVLHLAEAIKREPQSSFLQGLEDTAGWREPLSHLYLAFLLFLQPSIQFQRPRAHLSYMGLLAILGITRDHSAPSLPGHLLILFSELQAESQEERVLWAGFSFPAPLVSLGFSALGRHLLLPRCVLLQPQPLTQPLSSKMEFGRWHTSQSLSKSPLAPSSSPLTSSRGPFPIEVFLPEATFLNVVHPNTSGSF